MHSLAATGVIRNLSFAVCLFPPSPRRQHPRPRVLFDLFCLFHFARSPTTAVCPDVWCAPTSSRPASPTPNTLTHTDYAYNTTPTLLWRSSIDRSPTVTDPCFLKIADATISNNRPQWVSTYPMFTVADLVCRWKLSLGFFFLLSIGFGFLTE